VENVYAAENSKSVATNVKPRALRVSANNGILPMTSRNSESLLLLTVDDDDLYREYMAKLLRLQGNWQTFEADSSASMIESLEKNPIDCILLDYNMGAENGLSMAEMVRKNFVDPPPIIMLTGEGRDKTIIKAFRGGFSDFVSKQNLSVDELLHAIRGAVDRKLAHRIDRDELKRLSSLSSFDSATGLHNAEFMTQKAAELVASARRRTASCCAIIIGVYGLTAIGDSFGTVMRSRALQAFAARLKKTVRETDICGRYGEHSFLCLVDRDVSSLGIANFCERLSRELSFQADFEEASFTFAVTAGVAMFPQAGEEVEQLLRAAELATVQAKDRGLAFVVASSSDPGNGKAAGANDSGPGTIHSPGELSINRLVDRRCERRQRVLKRGRIITHGVQTVIDCMIRDISQNGARLRLNEYYAPPDKFTLMFVDSGDKRSVDVRWRIGADVGVRFTS
jgi:diguanylate cyclase (GGDEF)-like protein